jgi:predicted permease
VHATILEDVGVEDPGTLVTLAVTDTRTNNPVAMLYRDAVDALRQGVTSLSSLTMYWTVPVRVEAAGHGAFLAGTEGVLPEYFTILGTRAAFGRLFTDADGPLAEMAVVSDRLARRLFVEPHRAVDARIIADGRPVTIVGVAPPGFLGLRIDDGADLFLPIALLRSFAEPKGVVRGQNAVGRLAPGASLRQARADIEGRWPAIVEDTAGVLAPALQAMAKSLRVTVTSGRNGLSPLRGLYGDSLVMLMGLAAILLIVGAVNLSGLMLARGLTRQHEFEVRKALGAPRSCLLRQTLLDGVLLSAGALIVAVPITWWAANSLRAMLSVARATPLHPLTPDWKVMATAAVVSLILGLVIGVLPARRAARASAIDALRSGRGVPRTLGWPGRVMLIAQIAVSMILVFGAGLFGNTLSNLYANDAEVRTRPIVWTRPARNPVEPSATLPLSYYTELHRRLASIPGVDAAAFSSYYPAYLGFPGGAAMHRFEPVGAAPESAIVSGIIEVISPGFFELFGISRLRGRDLEWSDGESAPAVAVVSHSLAEKLFDRGDAVGQRLAITSGRTRSEVAIVGIVADAPIVNIRDRHIAVVYRPMMQDLTAAPSPMAHVRVTGDVATVRREYVNAVNALGRQVVLGLFTMDEWVDNALLQERLLAGVASFGAALAIVLACVGIFGLLAYSVAARVREIGVRMSVGATRAAVVALIVREGLIVVLPGIVIGIPLALAAARLVRSRLYGISDGDPWAMLWASGVFVVAGGLAALLPALRASRIQPIEALRHE